MIVETIIEINKMKVPIGFLDKSKVIDNLISSGKLVVPCIIDYNDWLYIFALYNSFREKRTIIVHRKVFKVENDDKIFVGKDILMDLLTGNNSEIYCEALRNSLRKEINELIIFLESKFSALPIKYILVNIICYVINDKNDNKVV